MPRSLRMKANSGIYHVMLRGVNKQTIFEDEKDKLKLLRIIYDLKREFPSFDLYGLCLMENHIHLLYKENPGKDLSEIIKLIELKYVFYFNNKYQRIGPLFQGRFKSIPVEDKEYLAGVLRYIHQNPVKASLCLIPSAYPYSSYTTYFPSPGSLVGANPVSYVVSTDYVINTFGREWLKEYTDLPNDDVFMDIDEIPKPTYMSDEDAIDFINRSARVKSPKDICTFNKDLRNRAIVYFIKNGVNIRQLSRLTSIPRHIIRSLPGVVSRGGVSAGGVSRGGG